MSNIGNRIVVILCCLLAGPTYVSAQEHVCYVRYSYVDTQTRIISSFFGLGEFRTSLAEETVTKSFKHEESNITVNVGVGYPSRTIDNKDAGIILAIAFSGRQEDVFYEVGGSQAQAGGSNSMRDSLTLSKSVRAGDRVWKFYLSCVPKKRTRS
jgi:hypothetical protein